MNQISKSKASIIADENVYLNESINSITSKMLSLEMSVVTSSVKSRRGFTNVQTLKDALISSKFRLIQKRESMVFKSDILLSDH